MGAALSTSWRVARPLVNCTVGDLEWWQVSALPFDAWGERIRVWPAHVDPTVAYHERVHVVAGDEVLETWPIDLRGW